MTSESMIVWSDCSVLEHIAGETGDEWVFRGTQIPYWAVLDRLGKDTVNEIAAQHPPVSPDQLVELLDFIADSVEPDREHSATRTSTSSNPQ